MGSTDPSSIDNFGTYLNEMRGSTIMERMLQRTREGAVTVGALAKELDGSPQDVVSAVVRAEELGLVKLDKQGDETLVIPLSK
jgi:hypothetical protein